MSLWSDMRSKSNGETVRKEDRILDKERLIDAVKEMIPKGNGNLAGILGALHVRLSFPDIVPTFSVQITDDEKLLSEEEVLLLYTTLCLEFKFWDYVSLEDMLNKLGVRVIIDPREPERLIPSDLEEEKEFWEEKVRKNLNDEFAKKMLEEVLEMIKEWGKMILLGLYDRAKKAIFLFPNNMKKAVNDKDKTTMDKLLASTLVHEAIYAYFDRTPLDQLPYIYSTEEPMAEFGMLLYMKETNLSDYFAWAKDYVCGKKTCYRYGYALIMQYEKEIESSTTSRTREDFVFYKAICPSFIFAMPKVGKVARKSATAKSSMLPAMTTHKSTSKHRGKRDLFTDNQIANSIKAYLFNGMSFRVIEHSYLGMPKRANGGGWAAKNLLENKSLDSSMKNMFSGRTIADAIAMSSEPLKSTLMWMDANL